jgi:hypothetical protein
MGFDLGSAISGLIQGIVSPIANVITRKAELNEAQHVADLAAVKAQGDRQVALISQGLSADANWEMESLRAGSGLARNSELVIVSIPLVMCFFPSGAAIVKAGFTALSGTPVWYQGILLMIYAANYGVRMWRRQQSDT